MIRLTDSVVSVANGASDAAVESVIANLDQLIVGKGLAKPMAIKFVKDAASTPTNAEITIKKLVLASDKNPEAQYQIYKGAGMSLDDINELLSPAAGAGLSFTIVPFDVEHGLKAIMTLSNSDGTNTYTGRILWKVANAVPGFGLVTATQGPGLPGLQNAIEKNPTTDGSGVALKRNANARDNFPGFGQITVDSL